MEFELKDSTIDDGATSQGRFTFEGATSTRAINSAPFEDKTFVVDTEGVIGSMIYLSLRC